MQCREASKMQRPTRRRQVIKNISSGTLLIFCSTAMSSVQLGRTVRCSLEIAFNYLQLHHCNNVSSHQIYQLKGVSNSFSSASLIRSYLPSGPHSLLGSGKHRLPY